MKENYSTYQEMAILDTAKRWKETPERIRQLLDAMYDANFDDDLAFVENHLYELRQDKAYKYQDA